MADGPIFVNLDGSYKIEGDKPVASSISGDLRLHALDAFLSGLNDTVSDGEALGSVKLADFLNDASRRLRKIDRLKGVELEITSTLDPKDHTLKYTFRLRSVESS